MLVAGVKEPGAQMFRCQEALCSRFSPPTAAPDNPHDHAPPRPPGTAPRPRLVLRAIKYGGRGTPCKHRTPHPPAFQLCLLCAPRGVPRALFTSVPSPAAARGKAQCSAPCCGGPPAHSYVAAVRSCAALHRLNPSKLAKRRPRPSIQLCCSASQTAAQGLTTERPDCGRPHRRAPPATAPLQVLVSSSMAVSPRCVSEFDASVAGAVFGAVSGHRLETPGASNCLQQKVHGVRKRTGCIRSTWVRGRSATGCHRLAPDDQGRWLVFQSGDSPSVPTEAGRS